MALLELGKFIGYLNIQILKILVDPASILIKEDIGMFVCTSHLKRVNQTALKI